MRPVRMGVIGLGHLGQHHARILSRLDSVELTAIVDIDHDRAQEIGRRTGARPYADYREIIGKVDAVSVVVPTNVHYAVAKEFLQAGKDVLIEKPITNSVYQALELIELANRNNLILQVGHLERFNSAVTKLEDIITEPGYIESQRLSPFPGRSMDIDVILDLMIHDLDVILSFVKSKVRSVKAIGHPVLTSSIDMASAWLEFENGCVANVTASRVSKERIRKMRIFQPESYISLDYQLQRLTVMNRVAGANGQSLPHLVEVVHELKKAEPLKVELDAFARSVQTRTPPKVSGRDGLDALRLALQVADVIEPRVRAFNMFIPSVREGLARVEAAT